ncbi:hypothetical protein [Pelotomaculum sp. PtaB.Bin117]|uniref:hypothetical protein n=1 Tax=Pelotomaculum sp. PtaB.Bin117 TaxID=1811694 RepID=UPI002580B4B8|nr:hypothetical protein [Pelotomaculum sp. PtaB.Bin117]
MTVHPQDIFITSGATQALPILAELLSGHGKDIWMEDHISSFWEGYFRRLVVPRCSGPRKKMPRGIYVGTFRKDHRIQESRKNTDDK